METMIVRTVFLYIVILATLRIMRKREIGQLSVIDFVVTIMIAELCVGAIEQPDAPMTRTLIPIVILLSIQISLAFLAIKSNTLRHLVEGVPTTIIRNGQVDENQMKKQRFKFEDLLMQLREQNIKHVSDVEFAYLETDGKLSVTKKEETNHAPSQEWEIDHHQLPLLLILDGVIQHDSLQKIGKNTFWLRQKLKQIEYTHIKDISSCILDDKGTFVIEEKNKNKWR